jgi:hypothetical protein
LLTSRKIKRRKINMEDKNTPITFSAARIVASIFGALAGLGGLTHGIGEVLQGNVASDGI